MKKVFFIIDAYFLIFRSYFAFIKNPQINSKGFNTSVIMGFINSLLKILIKERPTHLVIVFDIKGKNFRHKEYIHYKSNRKKTPIEIKNSINYIYKILKALNITFIYKKGYEADDIIGTLAMKAYYEKFIIYIVTNDKDFLQLVNNNIKIYKIYNQKIHIIDINTIYKIYKIKNPIQMIDYFSLIGDKADNIPGIPKIGKKKAIYLINKFINIENMIKNINIIDNNIIQYNIKKHQKLLIIYKKLITIITNVPITWNSNNFLIKPIKYIKLYKIFEELEFKKLLLIILKYTNI